MSIENKVKSLLSGRFSLMKMLYLYLKCVLMPASKEFKALKNKYDGGKCYIVALGPSLNIEDLELLQSNKGICFSVNGIFDLFDKTSWRPDYYFMSDPQPEESEFMRRFKSIRHELPVCFYNQLFRAKYREDAIPYKANIVHTVMENSKSKFIRKADYRCKFSKDASRFVYDGNTCIISIIQLAYYMGFDKVFLLGTDCSANIDKFHSEGLEKTYIEDDIDVQKYMWNEMLVDYAYLYRDMKKKKIPMKIYNATRGGCLEVFPRISLEESFNM